MLSQYFTLLLLSGIAFAIPQPQDLFADTISTSEPSLDDEINTGIFSDMPTLPVSIYEILATAAPKDEATMTDDYPCDPTAAPFFSKLPKDVQGSLVSYNAAVKSWALAHISELGDDMPTQVLKCLTTTANSKDKASATGGQIASNTMDVTGGVVETGSLTRTTGTASVTGSSTITPAANASASGVVAGGSVSKSGTGVVGGSVTTTQSPGAAPRATGAIMGGFAGLVGALGVVALL